MYRYACLPPPQFASFRECLSYTPPKFVSGSGKSSHPAKLFRSATLQNSAYNPHLRQVDGALTVEVLPGVVVAQLVLDRVQDEPALLPGLQQGTPLVQVTLHTITPLVQTSTRIEPLPRCHSYLLCFCNIEEGDQYYSVFQIHIRFMQITDSNPAFFFFLSEIFCIFFQLYDYLLKNCYFCNIPINTKISS